MTQENPRRSFIGKLTFAITSIFAVASKSFGDVKQEEKIMNKTQDPTHPIIKIKALGFQWETSDPFLFCVHHDDQFPRGNDDMAPQPSLLKGRQLGSDFVIKDGWRMYHGRKVPGFPGHPHRGFETITVVRDGIVDHADSLGAAGRYGDGDVQWMTAGGGVQHSEMFPLIHKDKENHMELFQIWLNLPKKDKMVKAHFKMLWGDTIPKENHKDPMGKNTLVEVVTGNLANHKPPAAPPNSWANDAGNEVAIWNIKMDPGATWTVPAASAGLNRTLYYYVGNGLQMAGKGIEHYHAAEVISDQDIVLQNGNEESRILLLQGKPIGEPVVQHGPFVMNTKQEINQAFEDYHRTQFGGWPWPKSDMVHDRSKTRFALHADGREETKKI